MKTLNLKRLKEQLANQQFSAAAAEIETVINALKQHEFFSTAPSADSIDSTAHAFCTQLSECLAVLFTSYPYQLNESMFLGWLCFGREIQAIFAISKFQTTDHLLEQWVALLSSLLSSTDQNEKTRQDLQQLMMRILLFYAFDNQTQVDLEVIHRTFPNLVSPTLFNLLSTQVVHSLSGYERRETALGLNHLVDAYHIKDPIVVINLCIAWMMVSYGARPDKNEIKKSINRCLSRWLAQHKVEITLQSLPRNTSLGKPTLMMVWEYFAPIHAMTRAFAPLIAQLSEKFNLIALMLNEGDDLGEYQRYYQKVIKFDVPITTILKNMPLFRKKIASIQHAKPEVIYYPSIGMQEVGVFLANLRLAPIQVMGLGHPASSYSPHIDYCMVEANLAPDTYLNHSEKLIILPNQTQPILPLSGIQNVCKTLQKSNEVILVAISAMIAKISAPFLEACLAICKQATRPVKFIFFIYQSELLHLQSKKYILSTIPRAQVYSRLAPEKYIELLNQCHLYLSTFPFCGANSIIDAICLGLPMVTLAGADPSSLTGAALMRNYQLPEALIAKSREEYIASALQLIHNDQERLEMSKSILEKGHELLNPENPAFFSKTNNLAQAISQLYLKHELIKQHDNQRYSFDQLLQFPTGS